MTDHYSKARYLLLVFLTLILAGCRSNKSREPLSASAATQDPSLSAPAQTPTPTPVVLENGWYLYTDPQGEFSFSYPPTTTISAGQNPVDFSKNITLQFQVPEKSYQGMSIRVELNPKKLQGAEIAKQLYETSAQKSASPEFASSLQQTLVGGKPAVQASIPSTNTEVTIIIPYGDKVFIAAPVHGTFVTQVEKGTLDLFYQIIHTIKFGSTQ